MKLELIIQSEVSQKEKHQYSILMHIYRFVFSFCSLFRWGILHRALLVVGWCQVWYYSGFLCFFLTQYKAEWGGNPVCWWLGLYFCFVCCLGEMSCTGCLWLGDAGSCIQAVSFVWALTIWYSVGLILW